MSFQYENIILPDEPVLLVDRDWKIPGRKPRKSKRDQIGGVQSFRVKGQTDAPRKIQLAARTAKSSSTIQSSCTGTASKASARREREKREAKKEQSEQEFDTAEQTILSDSSSSDGEVFDARLLDNHDYTLVPTSQSPPGPGLDNVLMKFTYYHVPDFISTAYFFDFYVEHVGNFFYPLKGMYTLNPLRNYWLPIILVDELWFYTILYAVARHLEASPQHRSYEREAAFLADALIVRLRNRLQRSGGGEFLTDIDCAAVSCLLGIEHAFGTKDGLNQHARGLAEFVKKRGGMKGIGGVLRIKICRADIEASVDHAIAPAIPLCEQSEPISTRLRLAQTISDDVLNVKTSPVLRHLSPRLIDVATDFLILSNFVDQEIKASRLLDPFVLDESITSLQHRIVGSNDSGLTNLDKAFLIACLIFIKCLGRPLNVVSATSTPLAIRLARHLEKVEETPRPLLTWLLYMGLIAGDPLCLDRIGMASRLVDELRTTEGTLQPWNAVEEQLREIAWVDLVLDGIGEKVWMEMETVALIQ